MDLTNRALIIGVSLVWIFLVMVVVLLAWAAPEDSIERIRDLAVYLEDHNETSTQLIITFGGLILILLGLVLMIYEASPPSAGSLRVMLTGGGTARIDADEAARRVEEELRIMPQLREVHAEVVSRGDKAEVSLQLQVGEEADLTATTEEACGRARQLLEERMGVTLSRPPHASLFYRTLRVSKKAEPPTAQSASAGAQPTVAVSTPPAPAPVTEARPQTPFARPQASGASPEPTANPEPAMKDSTESSDDATKTTEEDPPANS